MIGIGITEMRSCSRGEGLGTTLDIGKVQIYSQGEDGCQQMESY